MVPSSLWKFYSAKTSLLFGFDPTSEYWTVQYFKWFWNLYYWYVRTLPVRSTSGRFRNFSAGKSSALQNRVFSSTCIHSTKRSRIEIWKNQNELGFLIPSFEQIQFRNHLANALYSGRHLKALVKYNKNFQKFVCLSFRWRILQTNTK